MTKVTLKEEYREEAEISPETVVAIEAFRKVVALEAKLEKESEKWLTFVPDEDMPAYVNITQRIYEGK